MGILMTLHLRHVLLHRYIKVEFPAWGVYFEQCQLSKYLD